MQKQTVFDNWAGGVITSMRPDALPNAASPRGRNSVLGFLAGGQAVSSKRPGFELINTAPISGRPSIVGQFEFERYVSGVLTSTHLLVGSDGSLTTPSGSSAPTAVDGASPSPFTVDTAPQFAVLNNLCFIVNGTDQKKLSAAGAVQNFGIAAPSAAPTVTDSGVAGTPTGTYEFALSYYNSTTGHESSRGPMGSVTVAGKKITVSWLAPTDPQVDYVFVNVRKGTIMSEFFRLIIGTTPASASNGGFPVATLSISVDVSDAELTALELLAPDTAENDPPPSGLVSLAAHLSRLFAADTQNVYFSKVNLPEAFDPDAYEPVNPSDGQSIVALGSFFGALVIWKTASLYALNGVDPGSWSVDNIDPAVGAVSASSIKYHDGMLYWWSKSGPVMWGGPGSPIQTIGLDLIAPSIDRDVLNHDLLGNVVTEVDANNNLVLFSVPESGETRNSLMLPFHVKQKTWTSDGWNPFDVASMAVVKDANGKPFVMMGNYGGRLFRFANADTDGARLSDGGSTLFTLQGTVTSATSITLVDSGATFDTTDDGLRELYVYAIGPDGQVQRRRITSNTGTSLTVTPAWDATPDDTYRYSIAAAHWEWDTKWDANELPFNMKRGLFHFCQLLSDSGAATIQVDIFKDYDIYNPISTFTFTASGVGALFDVSLFDDAIFGEVGITHNRRWVGKKFRSYRVRYSNVEPNVKIALVTSSMKVSVLSEKN